MFSTTYKFKCRTCLFRSDEKKKTFKDLFFVKKSIKYNSYIFFLLLLNKNKSNF